MPSRLPLLFRKIFVVSSPISSVASSAQVSWKVYWLRFLSKGSFQLYADENIADKGFTKEPRMNLHE